MKKRLIYWLAAIPLIFTACVEDEYAEGSRTPIQFTVNMAGDKGITRSNTVNDVWTDGDPVAVQMKSGGTSIVKKYKINHTVSAVELVPDAGVEPFYWPNSNITSVTVSAWYPYAATKPTADNTNTSITDQSTADNYEAANLMETAEVTHTFSEGEAARAFNLTFAHKMAKLIIVPYYYKNKDGNRSRLIKADVEKTTAYAINVCKNPSNDNNIPITAYKNLADEDDCKFEVLVAPQSIPADTKFIRLSYANSESHNSQTFEFSTTAQALEAGKTYIFNVNFNTAADSAFVVTLNTAETPTYDGTQKNYPGINSVKCNGKTLTVNVDYVIDEANSTLSVTNAGTYDVTIKGTGQYRGTNTRTVQWTINKAHETGSISYAPTPINKTVGAEPFTNTLSNNINHGNVRYTSSNEYVATVDSNGLVTIHHAGSCTITATVEDANYTFDSNTASYDLTVSAAPTTL